MGFQGGRPRPIPISFMEYRQANKKAHPYEGWAMSRKLKQGELARHLEGNLQSLLIQSSILSEP